ncbi:DUF5455 family protein [Salinicola endophyticus]|uniref:DUF5455 family protein n=1 Tax=Salinicola endophyticus TaxID=1949083 RepID=UPI000DA1FBFD|nr:DUF5455 family protein [Salinicola endophyticus]
MGALVRLLFTALIPLARNFFKHFGTWFLQFFFWLKVARFGLFLIKVGIFVALITGTADVISSIVDSLTVAMPSVLADGVNRILPDNFSTCVSAIVLAKFTVMALHVKDRVLGLGGV